MNTVFADASLASIRSLSLLGYDVVIPRGIGCCGAPHMTLGEVDIARRLARQNLRCFDGIERIVADCAACSAEMKHYGTLLGDGEARAFSARVRDFTEFVAPDVPAVTARTEPTTYHAACHLAHAQQVGSAPEDIVRRLCPDYRPLTEMDRCCGSAGVYWAQHPDIADHALNRKLSRIRETGAEIVVTANPGCILQLIAGRSAEDSWRVEHVSRIVLSALESVRKSDADTEARK
jgi:glycolate oxidase iron-sulfur subunit